MGNSYRQMPLGLLLAVLLGLAGLSFVSAQEKKGAKAPGVTAFEIYKDKAGEFRFRLKDKEGDILAISGKGYETKPACQKVIDAIKKDAAKAKVDDESK